MLEREQSDFEKAIAEILSVQAGSQFEALLSPAKSLPQVEFVERIRTVQEQVAWEHLQRLEPHAQSRVVQRWLEGSYPRLEISVRVEVTFTIVHSLYQVMPTQEEEQQLSPEERATLKEQWKRVAEELDKFNEHVQSRAKPAQSRSK